MRIILIVFFFFPSMLSFAGAGDTTRTLSETEFLNIVRSYHPVARQASLLVERAKADLISARAGFDPAFYMYSDRKTFDGKNYYQYTNPELKIPTWFGIEVKAGLENNRGSFTDPQLSLEKSSYLGVSVPVGKNLLMDKRRAVLQQAKIFRDQSRAEQALIVNDLLLDAVDAYWTWVRHYEVYTILKDAVTVNEVRFKLVKLGYRQGDRPAIDTTEALAQLQTFEMARNDAWVNARNAALDLSNYMWMANDSAYYLPEDIIPDSTWKQLNIPAASLPVLDELVATARDAHPKLQSFDYKLQILDVERRLKFQNLLPTLNLRYNVLNSGYNVFKDASWAFYENNYKFGFDFGLPLRLSQGRGEFRAAKIKIQETNLDLMQTRLSITNKVKSYFNELANLQQQVRIAENNLDNYQRLFRGEDTRFQIGESSLFLLNSRENKVLESRQKMVELKTKFLKGEKAVLWAAGQLR
jgi:outer membrane protein TolC